MSGTCNVDIYLDGVPLSDPLEDMFAEDLAGIELYDMESAPVQYRRSSSAGSSGEGRVRSCKVLLLWSKF